MRPSDPLGLWSDSGSEAEPDGRDELAAIDAVLRGEAVAGEFAELAELSLLLVVDRPRLDPDRAQALDERVFGRRSARAVSAAPARRVGAGRMGTYGLVGALGAGLIAFVLVVGGGGSRSGAINSSAGSSSAASSPAPREHFLARKPVNLNPLSAPGSPKSAKRASTYGSAGRATAAGNGFLTTPLAPAPTPNGRRIVASAQLMLAAAPRQIDAVAQEVFDVVGDERGIVKSSSVISGAGAGATFSLSIPSANLPTTMTRLSSLRGARVASRTDASQDVNNTYLADQRRLADARSLRAALLRQLDDAITTGEIDSLQARIHAAESTIASESSSLGSLNTRIAFSTLSVQIEPAAMGSGGGSGGGGHGAGGGFTLARAGHDAVRVLVVTAGAILIGLAALVPIALLALLGFRVAVLTRRRRRDAALDAA